MNGIILSSGNRIFLLPKAYLSKNDINVTIFDHFFDFYRPEKTGSIRQL